MSQEFTGIVLDVALKTGTSKDGKAWESRQITVTDKNEHEQIVVLDAFGDKFAGINVGDEITAFFNFKGNEYNGKWYNRVNAWKINVLSTAKEEAASEDPLGLGTGQNAAQAAAKKVVENAAVDAAPAAEDDNDDDKLPF